jgi:hypothetical protein
MMTRLRGCVRLALSVRVPGNCDQGAIIYSVISFPVAQRRLLNGT